MEKQVKIKKEPLQSTLEATNNLSRLGNLLCYNKVMVPNFILKILVFISVVDMLGALGELFCVTKKALHVKDEFGIQDLDNTDNTQVCN